MGNVDRNTVKHHCLHRLFGDPIKARVVRFIPIKWHHKIGFRFEVYGFRGKLTLLIRYYNDLYVN